ncbi:MAG: 6-phosphogluconolactonase [Pseudomonadota bacterium]
MDSEELELWEAGDADEFAASVAGDIGFIVDQALDARREALVALPVEDYLLPAYQKLAEGKRDWRHVTFVPTHDALVAVDDPASRVATLARIFLPKGARVLPLSSENPDYHLAGTAADARLQDLGWPLDLVVLSMDLGGGVAGLVDGPDLEQALTDDTVRALGLMSDDGDEVVSISKTTIVKSRTLMFALDSEMHREALESGAEKGAGAETIVGKILADVTVPVDVHMHDH